MAPYHYISEVCLYVKDIEPVQQFYEEVVGLKRVREGKPDPTFPGTPASFHMYTNPMGPNVFLNVLGPLGPESVMVNRRLEQVGEGFNHCNFVADNWYKVYAYSAALGIRMIVPTGEVWKPGGPFSEETGGPLCVYLDPRKTQKFFIEVMDVYMGGPNQTADSKQTLPTYLSEVCVFVRDIEPARRIYEDIFGLKAERDEVIFKGSPAVNNMVSYPVGPNVFLSVCAPIGPESIVVNKALEKRGEGVDHICFASRDAEKIVEKCRARGFPINDVEGQPWEHGKGLNCFVGPVYGLVLQIVKPPYELEYM